jgi:hypothetical protein
MDDLAGEITRLLKTAAQTDEGEEQSGATERFDIVVLRQDNGLLISATKREPVLERNHLPNLESAT